MQLEIIGAPQSSFVRTVRIALEEKGVAYRLTSAMPHSAEVEAIHPLGRIPVMRHGEVELFESRAIAGYVDRVFPGLRLFPEDALGAARIEQWVSVCTSTILPELNRYLQYFFFSGRQDGTPDEAGMAARLPEVRRLLQILDRAVAKNGQLATEDFSYADMNLLPVLYYLSDVVESAEVLAMLEHLPAYLTTHAGRESVMATRPPAFAERTG